MNDVKIAGDKSYAFVIAASQSYFTIIHRFSSGINVIQGGPRRTSKPESRCNQRLVQSRGHISMTYYLHTDCLFETIRIAM